MNLKGIMAIVGMTGALSVGGGVTLMLISQEDTLPPPPAFFTLPTKPFESLCTEYNIASLCDQIETLLPRRL